MTREKFDDKMKLIQEEETKDLGMIQDVEEANEMIGMTIVEMEHRTEKMISLKVDTKVDVIEVTIEAVKDVVKKAAREVVIEVIETAKIHLQLLIKINILIFVPLSLYSKIYPFLKPHHLQPLPPILSSKQIINI